MIPADLLELLRCPVTHQRLTVADPAVLARLNATARVSEPLEAALVRVDGSAAYPIQGNIPILLANEAIALS